MKQIFRFASSLQELNASHISHFQSVLPPQCVQTEDLNSYNEDWMKQYKGSSPLVLKPNTTLQISEILKYCNTNRLGVVPQGGNTGLVGGSVPVGREIILSLKNMNKIEKIDEIQGVVWCEAGVILEQLNSFCLEKGWVVPLDLASKGSCFIGGNLATNAGGVRYIRYGSLHGNVLGLEAVLPNGEVLCDLKALRKDNTGYDYKQLFIGSEGTLGVITRLALLLSPKPTSVNTAFLACQSFEQVATVLKKAKESLGEILSAYEFLDSKVFDVLLKYIPRTRSPFPAPHNFYILIETSGSNSAHDSEKFQSFLESCLQSSYITDGVIAQDLEQAENFWRLREGTATATKKSGKYVNKFDVSIRISEMYSLVEKVREKVGEHGEVMGYGHVGDGNLHLTIVSEQDEKIKELLYPHVYEEVKRLNGSISAEHGIGVLKRGLIGYTKEDSSVQYMVTPI